MTYKVSLSDLIFIVINNIAYKSVGRFLLPFKYTI